jgi:hypothetical protein
LSGSRSNISVHEQVPSVPIALSPPEYDDDTCQRLLEKMQRDTALLGSRLALMLTYYESLPRRQDVIIDDLEARYAALRAQAAAAFPSLFHS